MKQHGRKHERRRAGDSPKKRAGDASKAGQPGPGAHKRNHPDRTGATVDGPVQIFGIHAIDAALANTQRQITRLLVTPNAAQRLARGISARRINAEATTPKDLDRLLGADAVHQGALLETQPLAEPSLADLAERASERGPLLVLDQVTDPHNVGAILRSAAVFGAGGLIMTRRNSPPLAGTLAKVASGGLEHVPVALVPNLARALIVLADSGLQVLGLDGEGEDAIEDIGLGAPTALVLGAEGAGLRRLTRERCDRLVRISTQGPLRSLNVSNAAAICLYQAALSQR